MSQQNRDWQHSLLNPFTTQPAFCCWSWQKHLVIVLMNLWRRPTLQSVGWDHSKAAWGLIWVYKSGMAVNSWEHAECKTFGERNFMRLSGVSKDQKIFDKLLQGEFSLLQEIQGSKFDLQLHNSYSTNQFSMPVTSIQTFLLYTLYYHTNSLSVNVSAVV